MVLCIAIGMYEMRTCVDIMCTVQGTFLSILRDTVQATPVSLKSNDIFMLYSSTGLVICTHLIYIVILDALHTLILQFVSDMCERILRILLEVHVKEYGNVPKRC